MMSLAFYSALLSFIFLSVIGLKHMYDKYKLRKMVTKIPEAYSKFFLDKKCREQYEFEPTTATKTTRNTSFSWYTNKTTTGAWNFS